MGKVIPKPIDRSKLSVEANRIMDIIYAERPMVAVLLATHFIDQCLEKILRKKFIECDTTRIEDRDIIEADLKKGIVVNQLKKYSLDIKPFNKFQRLLIEEGGVVNLYKKHGGLKID